MCERLPDGRPVFTTFMDSPELRDFSQEQIEGSVTNELLREINVPLAPEWVERRFDRSLLEALLSSRRYRQLFSLVERGGLYEGAAFVSWMQERLSKKGHSRNITLEELARSNGCDLSVVAADTAESELLVLNRRTSPDVPVAWAVRMSMSTSVRLAGGSVAEGMGNLSRPRQDGQRCGGRRRALQFSAAAYRRTRRR